MKKILIALVALALVVPVVARAEYTGEISGYESPVSQVATDFRNTPINVHCVYDWNAWSGYVGPWGMVFTAFVPYADLNSIYLSPQICIEMLDATANRLVRPVTPGRAIALQTFLHEMMHSAGILDEHQAEEMSFYLYRWYLAKFWAYGGCQTKKMYEYAWVRHVMRSEQYSIPAKYHPSHLPAKCK